MSRILIVEDSLYQRSKLQHMLQTEGYQVLLAKDGREGLFMAASGEPDLVLLDLLMPQMGGIEFLTELRDKQLTLPVVVMTADIQELTRQKCLELGAKQVLNKPVQAAQLASTLARILSPKETEAAASDAQAQGGEHGPQ